MAVLANECGRSLFLGANARGEIFEGRMPQKTTKSWLRDWKNMGNDAFVAKDYAEAENRYTLAVNLYRNKWAESEKNEEIDDEDKLVISQIFTNRSACRFELGRYSDAVKDGQEAISIYPCHWKAYYRTSKAEEELGRKATSVQLLLRGVKYGRPEREQRCTMLVQALVISLKLPPDPFSILLGRNNQMKYVADIVGLIQNTQQWQRIFRSIAKQNEWYAARVLLDVVQGEDMMDCAKQTHLKGLVDYAEAASDRSWCDALAFNLLLHGAHSVTLEIDGDPAVFGALRLGLEGEGEFKTLRFFMESILVRDREGRNASNSQGMNLFQYIEQSRAEAETKAEARRLLRTYGVGVHVMGDEPFSALKSAQSHDNALPVFQDGEYEKALIRFTEAIGAIDSRTPLEAQAKIYSNRSAAYVRLGRLHEARRDVRQAVEILPTYIDAYKRLQVICGELELPMEEAMAALHVVRLESDEEAVEAFLRLLLSGPSNRGEQTKVEKVIKILNPSLATWTKIVEQKLYAEENWGMLLTLLSISPEKQGSLRDYRADNLPLSVLVCNEPFVDVTTYPLFVRLLARGAKPESCVPEFENPLAQMLIKGRPVSYAFVEAMLRACRYLDCLIERGDELEEPNYPDPANLLHRMIRAYKSLTVPKRLILIGILLTAAKEYAASPGRDSPLRETLVLDLNDPETALYKRCEVIVANVEHI